MYDPELASTCDASAAGAGGVWVGYQMQPTVWRLEWPQDMVHLYRKRTLTNLDLEMAALLLQYIVAEQIRRMNLHRMNLSHTAIWSDDSPATSWSTKMIDKATTPIAGQLLQALDMPQRRIRSSLLKHIGRHCLAVILKLSPRYTWGLPSHLNKQFLTAFNSVFSLFEFRQRPL